MEFSAVIYTYLPASLQARDMNFVSVYLGGWQFRENTRVHARVYGHACVLAYVCWMNKFLCFRLTAISSGNNFVW